MPTKTDQLKAVLARLRETDGVDGSVLVTRDGLPVVTDLEKAGGNETFSAMTAALLGAAETAVIEIGRKLRPPRSSSRAASTASTSSG